QQRPPTETRDGPFEMRKTAMPRAGDALEGSVGDQAVNEGRQQFLDAITLVIDGDPLAHVRHHRRVCGEDAVGDEAADARFAPPPHQARAAALAQAKQPDALWVGVRAAAQVRQRRPEIGHLEIGYPLQRVITRLPVAIPLAARLESEDVEAGTPQKLAVRS